MTSDVLRVHSIFQSIQGESSFAGLPCTFVRLSGCNLRCRYCDTREALSEGFHMSIEQVFTKVQQQAIDLVELTGGEPLIQEAARPLLGRLCESGRTVLLETSGEQDISHIDSRVHRIMDIKTPSSGESNRNRWQNISLLTKRDEIKFVVGNFDDYLWAREIIERDKLIDRVAEVLLSPVYGELEPRHLSSWILEDGLKVRLQLQLHKYIFGPDKKNV